MVNRAGWWVKDRDEKAASRYYKILEKRCPQTVIGRAAIAHHWFVDQAGAWSEEERVAREAMVPANAEE